METLRCWRVGITWIWVSPLIVLFVLFLPGLLFVMIVTGISEFFSIALDGPGFASDNHSRNVRGVPVGLLFFTESVGLYVMVGIGLHGRALRQGWGMGGWMRWLFVASFAVSLFYGGHFVWWHLTGQKFGCL